VSCPITSATTSITAKVMRYCTSLTLKDMRGGTKKKSNMATPSSAASVAGPRPKSSATPTTDSRNSMTMLVSSSTPCSAPASSAARAQAPVAAR
jgi:hypothetical protein